LDRGKTRYDNTYSIQNPSLIATNAEQLEGVSRASISIVINLIVRDNPINPPSKA
jgi:hypothetical protein